MKTKDITLRQVLDNPDLAIDAVNTVIGKDEIQHYRTAFFEAFPNNPDTFIRGEGATIEGAEKACWIKLQKYKACTNHEFEARGYTNGAGFCKHCGMFASKVIESPHGCMICGVKTWYSVDTDGNYWCEKHDKQKPRDKWTSTDIAIARLRREK